MVEVDELLEIHDEVGKVCYKTSIDDKNYICVGFFREGNEENKLEFKFFETKEEDGKLLTREIVEPDILQKLISEFTVEILEKTGLEEDFLKVFDN